MDLNLWNVKTLQAPSRNTYKAKNQDVDIYGLREAVAEALHIFNDQKSLHEEAALLSRCIYRMKLKFRSDKGLKAMEKMNRALLQYLRMNIPQTLETLHDMIPQKYTHNTYLPTLNMLHYVLVRIQGLSKLMIRVVDSAKCAAEFMELRIGLGHLWNVAFVCLGMISRIFVITKKLARYCCEFYSKLLPFTATLQNSGYCWLPSNYCLPQDLKSWLNVDWSDQDETPPKKLKKINVSPIFNIVDSDSDIEFYEEQAEIQDDVQITGEYFTISGDEHLDVSKNKPILSGINYSNVGTEVIKENAKMKLSISHSKEMSKEKNKLNVLQVEEDIGEVVHMHKNKKINSKKKRRQKGKPKEVTTDVLRLINKINTFEALVKFEKDFHIFINRHANSFKEMDRLQTNMLHNLLKKWANKAKKHGTHNSKVNLYISKAKEVLKSNLL